MVLLYALNGESMRFFVFAISYLLFAVAHADDLASLRACVQNRYALMTKRHAIVAAVLDREKTEILTFGSGSETQLFEIGSITKTFTANLLAQAILEGSLKLDDSIPENYQKPNSNITYRHLTTHTSGIISGMFPAFKANNELLPFEGLTIPIFKDLYANTPLENIPETKPSYSNMGVALLGLILSENAGKSYETLVEQKIFRPMEMSKTYFQVPENQLQNFSNGQLVNESGEKQEIPHWNLYQTAIDPAGGIVSNIRDMVKYARSNLSPETSPLRDSISLSHQPLVKYDDNGMWMGMNWVLKPEQKVVLHNGRTYGFNSILIASQIKGQAIVALTDTNYIKKDPQGVESFDESLQNVAFECIGLNKGDFRESLSSGARRITSGRC